MRKIYLILILFFLISIEGFSFDAIYVNGSEGQIINGAPSPGWKIGKEALKIVADNEGKFIISVKNYISIGISTKGDASDWHTWNTGQYSITNWVNGVDIYADVKNVADTDYPGRFVGEISAIQNKYGFVMAAPPGMNGDYTFIIDRDLKKVEIIPHSIYIAGPMDVEINGKRASWDINNSLKMDADDGIFRFNIKIPVHSADIRIDISTTSHVTGNRDWEFYNAGQFSAVVNNECLDKYVSLAHSDIPGLVFSSEIPTGNYLMEITEDLSRVRVSNSLLTEVNGVTVEDKLSVQGLKGEIVISGNVSDATVYNVSGYKLASFKVDKVKRISLSAGSYIVKADSMVKVVMVR